MKCPYCQEEVRESGFVYCPHCGKQLEPSKKKSIGSLILLAFIFLIILTAILVWLASILWSPFDLDDYLIMAGFSAIPALLYEFGVWIIHNNARRHKRNAVRWMTAAIVFTPVLAWIAYGLTWRKSQ